MAYKLKKPYTLDDRIEFIQKYNREEGLRIEETDDYLYALLPNEIMKNGRPYIDPDYDKKQEEKEKERISNLRCTKRVFALMLQELGISYIQLKDLIAENDQAQLEWDLCIELERKNPLLDIMASKMKITPEQLDLLFKYANDEITLEEFKGGI